MTQSDPLIGITMGDPAGIGGEIIAKAYDNASDFARLVVIGDTDRIRNAIEICEINLETRTIEDIADAVFEPGIVNVLDLNNVHEIEYGVVSSTNGQASLEYVERAIELATTGTIDGIVTAPIHKQATKQAGSDYAGHTGMLADHTNTENYSMMLIEDNLRVTHVSTHVPLQEACTLVTTENVLDTIRVTHEALVEIGMDEPKIAVAGLNPHASDGGLLGDEDLSEIQPAIERACEEGIDTEGPVSPDTVYVQAARGEYDCVVSMYHDEGHIPIKMLGFQANGAVSGVNMTIGLPIIRTSVDHGTAFDIAGEGIASPASMIDAVEIAAQTIRNQDTGSHKAG